MGLLLQMQFIIGKQVELFIFTLIIKLMVKKDKSKSERKKKITDEETELLETGATSVNWMELFKEIFK